jgi:hypothetical protein
MINLPQSILKDCCAVFRRALPKSNMGKAAASVQILGGRDGIRLRLLLPNIAVEYHHATVSGPFSFAIAWKEFAEWAGRGNGAVEFDLQKKDNVLIHAAGIPHGREVPLRTSTAPFPTWPNRDVANNPSLLEALANAMEIPTGGARRLSLAHIQMRGKQGDLVATDGQQLLVQGGFQFPWKDSLTLPRASVFAARELPKGQIVRVAQSLSHVHFRTGGWTIALPIETCGRFPKIDGVIPKTDHATTTLHLAETEALPLAAVLGKLPAANDDMSPITVDFCKPPAIRARAEGEERCAEVGLPRSRVEGKTARIVMNRQFLKRALEMGFRSFRITAPDKPILCENGASVYVCVALDPQSAALPPQRNTVRVVLPDTSSANRVAPKTPKHVLPQVLPPLAAARPRRPLRRPHTMLSGLMQGARNLWELVRKHRRKEKVN